MKQLILCSGLFSRAILQSASALCPWALNARPRAAALKVADVVGCPTDLGSQPLLECLQGLDAYDFPPLQIGLRVSGLFLLSRFSSRPQMN